MRLCIFTFTFISPPCLCMFGCAILGSCVYMYALQTCMHPCHGNLEVCQKQILVNERATLHWRCFLCLSTALYKTELVINTVLHLEKDSNTARNLNTSSEYLHLFFCLKFIRLPCICSKGWGNTASLVSSHVGTHFTGNLLSLLVSFFKQSKRHYLGTQGLS